jgi:hypothetical protein
MSNLPPLGDGGMDMPYEANPELVHIHEGMGQGAYCGRCLQVIDALTAAGFGESMREWAGA